MTLTELAKQSASIYHAGRVTDLGHARVYRVRDHDRTHLVFVPHPDNYAVCTCPHAGQEPCPHIGAAFLESGDLL